MIIVFVIINWLQYIFPALSIQGIIYRCVYTLDIGTLHIGTIFSLALPLLEYSHVSIYLLSLYSQLTVLIPITVNSLSLYIYTQCKMYP